MKRKIYLASSWRNEEYPPALRDLRGDGHLVYDFRADGFRWNELHPMLPNLGPRSWWNLLTVDAPWCKRAQAHFDTDFGALQAADTVVQMLPSGRSACWETGWALGAGKDVFLYISPVQQIEAELMALMFEPRVYLHWEELRQALLAEEKEPLAPTPRTHPQPPSPPIDKEKRPARVKRSPQQ